MPASITINVPMNRVEGDLEISVEIDDGVVANAWSSGTMFRGIERMLVGRGALDGLVITPRICGICSTSHLTAASRALDMVAGVVPPPDAVRIRNVAQMTEHIQSDVRHTFLMFAADFVNQAYQGHPLHDEAVRRYAPFKGSTVIDVIRETKKVLEIVAIIGGQWPHSSYMVPGGIVSVPSAADLLQCRLILQQYRTWYERRILGCSLQRWTEVQSCSELDHWLEESPVHSQSELGFYIRFARSIGLDRIGRSHGSFLSCGSLDLPPGTSVPGSGGQQRLVPAGFHRGVEAGVFDQTKVAEHVAHSWYVDYDGGRHPMQGETLPYASGREGKKYSWAKAPRYDGSPAETGPLAEMVIAGNPLMTDLIRRDGPSAYARVLARLTRPVGLIPAMDAWLAETTGDGTFYTSPGEIVDGTGFGLTEASRGALGHWVRIEKGRIQHYQVITPTAWNASPRDTGGTRGPLEEALVGLRVHEAATPVELGHVARSFDLCLVCTVHMITRGRPIGHTTIGM